MGVSEDRIIQDFVAGKEKAFQEIYEKYVSMLRYFAGKYLQDERMVEDVLQDAFVSLWEGRKGFGHELAIKSFLYTGIRNRCLNVLRHEKIKQQYAGKFTDEPREDDFLEKVIEAELMDKLHQVFEEISPACKEVYRLSLEGKKHEEIAAELNISVNTVKKYKNNANHFMKNRMRNLNLLLFALKISDLKK